MMDTRGLVKLPSMALIEVGHFHVIPRCMSRPQRKKRLTNQSEPVVAPIARTKTNNRKAFTVVGFVFAAIAYTQLSVVVIGDELAGSTALVVRRGDLANLHFLDSDKSVCERKGASGSGGTFGFSTAYFCEGQLAMIIADRKLALFRVGYSATLKKFTE